MVNNGLCEITEVIPARKIHTLYDLLEDEEKPYALRVRNTELGMRQITIYADTDNIPYFKALLDDKIKA